LASDKLVSIQVIANSNTVAIPTHYLDNLVNTLGVRTQSSMVNVKDDEAVTYVNSKADLTVLG